MTYLLRTSKKINTYIGKKKKKTTKGRQQGIVRYRDKPYHERMLLWEREPRLISKHWWGYTRGHFQTGKRIMT